MRLGRLAPVALALVLSGCGSIGAIGLGPLDRDPPRRQAQRQPDTVTPAQSAPVETAPLPPPPGAQASADPLAPPPADGSLSPAAPTTAPPAPSQASGAEIGRTDLLGGWTVSSGSQSCQLFMTLTSWTGGYRASTRGCQGEPLKSISAWSLSGNQVVLSGQGGVPVARLYNSGANRFDGQTESGAQAISFFR